jgi:hypothetical protein
MSNETTPAPAAPAPAGKATAEQLQGYLTQQQELLASTQAFITALNGTPNTKFIAVAVGGAMDRVAEAGRYLKQQQAALTAAAAAASKK